MAATHNPEAVTLQQKNLTPDALGAIGVIVRCCAEIEDVINLYIASLISTNDFVVTLMLGKTGPLRRIEIAAYLSKLHGGDIAKNVDLITAPEIGTLVDCRNVVAHGILLGYSDAVGWSFATAKTLAPVGLDAAIEVRSYTTQQLQGKAFHGGMLLESLEKKLGVKEQRQARHGKALAPSRKAQPRKAKPSV